MDYIFLNYTYIFLESIFWGYTIFVLPLLIFFSVTKNASIRNELINWLAALNISFVLAMLANLINQTYAYVYVESNYVTPVDQGDKLYFLLGIIFKVLMGIVAILFLFKRFRVHWTLSALTILLINWYKIYYLVDGSYDEWVTYAPNMPGREFYSLIFFTTIFLSYVGLRIFGQLPHQSSWLNWNRRRAHVQ